MKKALIAGALYLVLFNGVFADVSNIDNKDILSEGFTCSTWASGNIFKYQYLGQGLSGVLFGVDIKLSNPAPTYYGKVVGMDIYESDTLLNNYADVINSNLVWKQGDSLNTSVNINGHNGIVSFNNPSVGAEYNFIPTKHYYLSPKFWTLDGGGICQTSYLYGSDDKDSYPFGEFVSDSNVKNIYFNLYGLSRLDNPPACTENCFPNVLFLPGLEASRLYIDEGGQENQLWEPNRQLDVQKLYLNEDGTSKNSDIYTRDVIDEALGTTNIYKSFIETMNGLVTDNTINRWESYAYDWRQDIQDIIDNGTQYYNGKLSLTAMLQTLIETSKNEKVTIIAHSNGGLLAKALMVKLQEDKIAGRNNLIDKIDKLILVAVPQIGTASAVPAVLHGFDQAKLGGLLLTTSNARELGRNMISAYGLLPTKEYINRVSASPITFTDNAILSGVTTNFLNTYGNVIDSYPEYKNFLFGQEGRAQPEISNTLLPIKLSVNLFSKAENLHNKIDAWVPPSSMKVYEVAGWGLDTVAGFEYYPKYYCSNPDLGTGTCGYVLDEKPIFTVNGDRTVVEPSAQYTGLIFGGTEKYWVNLYKYNGSKLILTKEHKNILEIPELNNFIMATIKKLNFEDSPILTTIRPINTSNRLRISIHSPVTLGVYDSGGNFTGKVCPTDSDFCFTKGEIPNSSYLEFGEGKYLNLPEENMQKVVLQGTDIGTFTYESEKVMPDNTVIKTKFVDIPVTPQTNVEVVVNSDTQNQELKLDTNNDNVMDITIQPNDVFDPVSYLQVMKEIIKDLDITKSRKNNFLNRIDNTIKAIQKRKIDKAKLKVERFVSILEKRIDRKEPKRPKPHQLTKTDAEQLLFMLDTLLNNLNK